jgi:PAS domain S-box-containing protein
MKKIKKELMSDINKNLLYNQVHFELLLKLYRTSSEEFFSVESIYELFTVIASEGLDIDRASYWKIDDDNLICVDLYDREQNKHYKNDVLQSKDLEVYFKALKEGIAIVADNVLTNKYTQELKDNYLIPLGITDMLDIPIRENGKLIGVFCCEHRDDPRKWSETDLGFARTLCDILAIKIERFNRHQLEKVLIENERKLSLITDNSNDGFLVIENRCITYISPSYCQLLGFTLDEVYSLKMENIFDYFHEEDAQKVKDFIYSSLQKRVKYFTYEFRFKGKNGKYHWREDSASVMYDENGNYTKYIVVSRDISALKKADEKVKRLYSLSKRLNEKLLDFTHIISHNIRSNTSNMSMIIDLIDDAKTEQEKAEYFELLKISNNKLSETIFHLNETIKIRLENESEKQKINVKSFIENVLISMNGIIKKDKVEITIDIPQNIDFNTIPSYFDSIIMNLLTNAIKYKSPHRNPKIKIKAEMINNQLHIAFSDNGIGIDLKRNKNKIFGMYKTFHSNHDATGLGLFMTKNHIEVLGGTISVESEVDVGTTFKIQL